MALTSNTLINSIKTLIIIAILIINIQCEFKDIDQGIPAFRAKPVARQAKKPLASLARDLDCKDAILEHCASEKTRSNFAILNCLRSVKIKDANLVSNKCENKLWSYMKALTKDMRYDTAATEVCKDEFVKIPECDRLDPGTGERISCLIENRDLVISASCKTFLKQVETLIFTDYRLINKFVDYCETDIEKFSCGRLDPLFDVTSQGLTINCLATKLKQLNKKCKKEMLRVAELQSDDFHLNRPLFHACKNDRELFCANVKSGDARVYNCLMKNKFHRKMSEDCREQLTLFQKEGNEDVKVKHSLYKKCKYSIVKYQCFPTTNITDNKVEMLLSTVLVCLEGAMEDGATDISKDCIIEMDTVKSNLMSDYQLSGQIVVSCSSEIHNQCHEFLEDREGKVLHCLMGLAQVKAKAEHIKDISDKCYEAVRALIAEVDVDENVHNDPILYESCEPVINKLCFHIKHGDVGIMDCLRTNIDDSLMTTECETRILEVEFFIVRDFKLDTKLYKACHKDAVEHCSADADWKNQKNPTNSPLIFSCLYHKMIENADLLNGHCMDRIRFSMHMRSKRVELDPRIQYSCLKDLARYCSEDKTHEEKGDEIICLQNNFENLEESCHQVITEITADSDIDATLDKILMKECHAMINIFCKDLMKMDTDNPGEIMQCLIDNKNDVRMNEKCHAGIHHHQLISLKDPQFSAKFFMLCKDDMKNLCTGRINNKTQALECLSENVRKAILLDTEVLVSHKCQSQLKLQLLERRENIELDPRLQKSCHNDILRYCNKKGFNQDKIIKCLMHHKRKLQPKCHTMMFNREQEFEVELADQVMMKLCRKYIKKLCVDDDPKEIFKCLVSNRKLIAEGDDRCHTFLVKRLRVRSTDYRLNPKLARTCHHDIKIYCSDMKHDDNVELNGVVLNCLKKHYNHKKKPLTNKKCHHHIEQLINRAIEDIVQDPIIADFCREEIHSYCIVGEDDEADEHVINTLTCLQRISEHPDKINSDCKNEIDRIRLEVKADIHFDQELYQSCKLDLEKYCSTVLSGNARLTSCLIEKYEENTLSKNCYVILDLRLQMWEPLARNDPESIGDVAENILRSPHRNYLSSIFLMIICSIFIGGLFCGRVTKRITAQMKNK